MTHSDGFGVDFVGTEGRVRVNRGRFILERGEKVIASYKGKEDEDTSLTQQLRIASEEYLKEAKVKLYRNENHVSDFLKCVQSRQAPITNEQIGGRSVSCCHLMNLAYAHQKKVEWNPEQLNFASGSGAPKWLTREYRGSWKV